MRILHVSDCYLPRVGGIELHVRDLAQRQREDGHQVTVATRTTAGPAADPDGVLRVAPGTRQWLSRLAPEVVHAHVSVVSPFALGAARRAASLGVPTVVTVHSLWTHVGPLPAIARDLWRMSSWPVTWTAVSERAALPVHDLLGVPVHVLPNAIDLAGWTPLEPPVDGPLRVLSVMRLTRVKRAVPLVRILGRVAERVDLRATIVGDGPERGAVERELRRLGLTDRVELAGVVERSTVRAHLRKASVFLAPAHRESFGIAALEARSSGLPVVASARSGVPTFVEHGRDGLLGANDDELAAHVVSLLSDPVLRRRIADHNRLVRPPHGWPDVLGLHRDLYAAAGAPASSFRPLGVGVAL